MPELTQLERVKSMMRYLPANGTAGLARCAERTLRRSPCPPARMTAATFRKAIRLGVYRVGCSARPAVEVNGRTLGATIATRRRDSGSITTRVVSRIHSGAGVRMLEHT